MTDTIIERFSPDGIKPDVYFRTHTRSLDRARNSINSSTKRKHIAQTLCRSMDAPLFIFFLLKGKRKRGERYKVIYINRTYMCVCIDDVGWGKGPHRWRDNQTKKNWYFLFCNQTLINESPLRSLRALLFTYCGRIFYKSCFSCVGDDVFIFHHLTPIFSRFHF